MITRQLGFAYLRGIIGAIIGGVAGYFVFKWILSQGYYALALPAALLGLGCGYLSRIVSNVLGALCGVAGVALAIFADWKLVDVFPADKSLFYFATHLHHLDRMAQIMIVLSGIFGAWFGRGRQPEGRRARNPTPNDPA